ncbi:hypothetical protein K7711_02710 [Nocardia sp. CA2R105]|uniref:hypothetical protein n=1 Tax=Nocardia coffeae TaxID=2873381 RepID=UPI001CA72B14|nr:hypothetical protein [Nocardia coffeae]MBY8855378.1 hypothetical protein [Nocardia coffeae]
MHIVTDCTHTETAVVPARFDARPGGSSDWIMVSTSQSDGIVIEPNYRFTRIAFSTDDRLPGCGRQRIRVTASPPQSPSTTVA